MEEVEVIDCPPEFLLASVTPPSTLLDMLDSSSSAEELDNCSGEVGGDGPMESGRNSPPPKCAICLGKCRQKCYTDSCRHQFCYRCLLEWSKIKAECPLCKQVFRSIIYNKKTYDRYQEHSISIVPPATSPNYSAQGNGAGGAGAARTAAPQVYHRLDFTLSQPPRFTYSATLRVQPSQSERLQQLFLHQSGDVQRFSREFPDDSIPSRQNGPEWRRYIYHRRLHARPLPDINGRMRECSAAFYRENPAQIHRLMPWINRELVALCRNNPAQVSIIIEDFPNLLMSHDITSPAFRERVCYWGRARTAHFIHELLNFARSPYDIIGYDRSVQYDPYYNNSVVVVSSSSSSSSGSGMSASEGEDDVVRVVEPTPGPSGSLENGGGPSGSSRRGRTQFTIETRSSDQTVIMTGSFGGTGVSGIVSVSTSGAQQQNGAGTSTNGYPDVSRMQPLTSMGPQPFEPVNSLEDGENISLSSSDSDDCRIVGALKPPHLRTPEMVSLESDSDSDVVFVNEQATTGRNQAMVSNTILEQLFPENLLTQELAKLGDEIFASEYNNGASTSSGGGSASGGMKKYYAKPRLNRPADGVGHKSIYESSESEKSRAEPSIPSDSESSSHDEVKFNIRTQAPVAIRKRKATKRRQVTPSGSSSANTSDECSTSDSQSCPSSSGCSSSHSSSSGSASDSDFISDNSPKVTRKNPRRSKTHSGRKSSKRRRKEEVKPKRRSKDKKRKSSSSKRSTSRKRPKLQTTKQPPKSSSESGKGTSVSCNSGPSAEILPSSSNASLKPTSSSKKRKMRSAVIKPNTAAKTVRQQQAPAAKKRRKAPICSELITSTDFSSDENQPDPVQNLPSVPATTVQQNRESLESSSSESGSSESCPIASLIRATKADELPAKQNTSSSSCSSSSSTSNTSCSLAGGNSERSNQLAPEHEPMDEEADEGGEEEEEEEEEDENNQSLESTGGEEVDVPAAQVIAVAAEVEL